MMTMMMMMMMMMRVLVTASVSSHSEIYFDHRSGHFCSHAPDGDEFYAARAFFFVLNISSIPCPRKSRPKVFFAVTLKIVTNFYQIWQVAAATSAEKCVLKLPTSPNVRTHSTL